jgi:acylphosphatase
MRIARRYAISGHVQGVGFRYFTQEAAQQEDIAGWVRNTPDGRVEIEAEGDAENMRQFDRTIRTGPIGSRVELVEAIDKPPSGPSSGGFRIR